MFIHKTADYAIRMLCYLATAKHPVSSGKLAAQLGVSSRYLLTICSELREAGFVQVTNGSSGGFLLCKDPQEISLLDVVLVVEDSLFEEFPCTEQRNRGLNEFYRRILEMLRNSFQQVTLHELASRE